MGTTYASHHHLHDPIPARQAQRTRYPARPGRRQLRRRAVFHFSSLAPSFPLSPFPLPSSPSLSSFLFLSFSPGMELELELGKKVYHVQFRKDAVEGRARAAGGREGDPGDFGRWFGGGGMM